MPVFLFLLLFASPLQAQTPGEAREELKGALSEIKESNHRQQQLHEKTTMLAHEMRALQQNMVMLAHRAEMLEKSLSDAEEKLIILEHTKQEKTQKLVDRQTELSSAISAMIKLSQMPPEAVTVMPGKLNETLATARALSVVTHAVEQEADELKAQLHELSTLEDKVRQNQKTVTEKKTQLESQQHRLSIKAKERAHLQSELDGQAREERERSKRLTEKSKDLQELVETLGRAEKKARERNARNTTLPSRLAYADRHGNFSSIKGRLHMPAAGTIISHYGNTNISQEFSKGLVIETRAQAQVVAPHGGEVVFAGPFRDYGRMVIIRHGEEYHSLLSGMEQIDCTPGQFLLEGEPVGTMSNHAGNHRLYVELRKDGKPVDPFPWFKG